MRLSKAVERFAATYCFDRSYAKSTINNYNYAVNILIQELGDIDVSKINLEDIRAFKHRLERENRDRNGVVAYLYKLRLFFVWLAKTEGLTFDPNDIIIPRRRFNVPDYFTVEEIEKLMQVAAPRERAMIALFYSTAMRVSELCQVRTRDAQREYIKIRGKRDIERQVRIDESAKYYIKEYLSTRTDGNPFLFYSAKGRGITKGGVQQALRDVGVKAGMEKMVSPKVFRHSTATDMLRNGCNLRYIQLYLGHADISTTQIYTHVGDKDAQDAYKAYHKPLKLLT